jgi:hypothetical protein
MPRNFTKESSFNHMHSDEKLLDECGVHNRQNNRIWTPTRNEANSMGMLFERDKFPPKFCRNKMANFIAKDRWSPSSRDLDPLDYCIWNEIVTGMKLDKVVCRNTLILEIKRAVRLLRKEVLLHSCKVWYTRVRRVGAGGGAYLKK